MESLTSHAASTRRFPSVRDNVSQEPFFNPPSLIACANGEVAPFVGHNAYARAARVLANVPADASKLI